MDGGDGDLTEIEATLTAQGEHTLLVIEDRGIDLKEALLHGAGWQVHVEDLTAYLTGRPAGDWKARWIELTPAYQERGIDAG